MYNATMWKISTLYHNLIIRISGYVQQTLSQYYSSFVGDIYLYNSRYALGQEAIAYSWRDARSYVY